MAPTENSFGLTASLRTYERDDGSQGLILDVAHTEGATTLRASWDEPTEEMATAARALLAILARDL